MTTDPNFVTTLDGSPAEPFSLAPTPMGTFRSATDMMRAACATAHNVPADRVTREYVVSLVIALEIQCEDLLAAWQ